MNPPLTSTLFFFVKGCDGVRRLVLAGAAVHFPVIKEKLDSSTNSPHKVIMVQHKGYPLSIVIDYLNMYTFFFNLEEPIILGKISTPAELFETALAAYDLGIQNVETVTCERIKEAIQYKSAEVVRRDFERNTYLTPEQVALVKARYKWAFQAVDGDAVPAPPPPPAYFVLIGSNELGYTLPVRAAEHSQVINQKLTNIDLPGNEFVVKHKGKALENIVRFLYAHTTESVASLCALSPLAELFETALAAHDLGIQKLEEDMIDWIRVTVKNMPAEHVRQQFEANTYLTAEQVAAVIALYPWAFPAPPPSD